MTFGPHFFSCLFSSLTRPHTFMFDQYSHLLLYLKKVANAIELCTLHGLEICERYATAMRSIIPPISAIAHLPDVVHIILSNGSSLVYALSQCVSIPAENDLTKGRRRWSNGHHSELVEALISSSRTSRALIHRDPSPRGLSCHLETMPPTVVFLVHAKVRVAAT